MIAVVGGLIGLALGVTLSRVIAVLAGWSTIVTLRVGLARVPRLSWRRLYLRRVSCHARRETRPGRGTPLRVGARLRAHGARLRVSLELEVGSWELTGPWAVTPFPPALSPDVMGP